MKQNLHPVNWSGRKGRRKEASPDMGRVIWATEGAVQSAERLFGWRVSDSGYIIRGILCAASEGGQRVLT